MSEALFRFAGERTELTLAQVLRRLPCEDSRAWARRASPTDAFPGKQCLCMAQRGVPRVDCIPAPEVAHG